MSQPKGLALQDATLQPLEEWKVYISGTVVCCGRFIGCYLIAG